MTDEYEPSEAQVKAAIRAMRKAAENCLTVPYADMLARAALRVVARVRDDEIANLRRALNIACQRGCDHCADDIKEARKICNAL